MLKDRIFEDMKAAMKSKEAKKLGILRFIKGEIDRSDDKSDKTIIKTIKKTIDNVQSDPNHDVYEVEVLSVYLPTKLSEEALASIVSEVIEANGYAGMKDMGNVMRHFEDNYNGQYDGGTLSKHVRKCLV